MRKFRNKKLATLIIAFLMVFVIAGAFAAFQRLLYLDARVNLFAPQIEIVWADLTLEEYPELWDEDTPLGLGLPGNALGRPRYFTRAWPAPPIGTPFQEYHGSYSSFPHAWWIVTSNDGTGLQNLGLGQFPDPEYLENQAMVNPRRYIHLSLGVVFDKYGQEYVFTAEVGNPSTFPLEIYEVNVMTTAAADEGDWMDAVSWDADWEFQPGAYVTLGDPAASPHTALITVSTPAWAGTVIQPGETQELELRFTAAGRDGWIEFFGTDAGETFLDNHFNTNVAAFYALEIVATLPS